jgi:predicted nucleotidyltransferase
MIRYTRLPEDILSHLTEAYDYLQSRSDLQFAYLFGGLAKGNLTPLSDIDIAVYLSDKTRFRFRKFVYFKKQKSMCIHVCLWPNDFCFIDF